MFKYRLMPNMTVIMTKINLKSKAMKKTSILIIIACSMLFTGVYAQEVYKNNKLTQIWETTDSLITPESVLYDPATRLLYVACINENPWQKDGNGYISKDSTEGKIINPKWATGLSAPKGMGINQGKLYVTNIDEVVEIDLESGAIIGRFTHPRAINLNDIAVSGNGNVYVSDSKGDCLFQLKSSKLEILSDSPEIKASNGLYLEKGLLLLGQQNRIAALNLLSLKVSSLIENTGSIDGIEAIGHNTYLISDWMGHIYEVEPGKEKKLLLDTTPINMNAADIGFNRSENILYVPTFFKNGVTAYKLN